MELTDILSIEEWKSFEKEIADRFEIDANVFNTKGIRITDHKSWANDLCPRIKATDKGQSFICAVAHMNIATMARNSRAPSVEECDAGIMKMVIPIFVDDEFIGAVGACGVLMPDGEVDSFLVNKITEMDYENIEALSASVHGLSQEKIDALEQFISHRLEEIVANYNHRA